MKDWINISTSMGYAGPISFPLESWPREILFSSN